ncbi:MAG: ATP-binding protein [Kofleriaceae bacterium]
MLQWRMAERAPPADELADLRAFNAALLAAVPGFVCRTDADRRLVAMTRYAPGYTPANSLGRDVLDFLPPEAHASATAAFDHVQATGEPASYATAGPGDEGPSYYATHVTAVPLPDGRRGLCLCAIDVTEARRRELALRATSDQLAMARELSGLGLWSLDLGAGEVAWDRRMSEIVGAPRPRGLLEYLALVHPDDRAEVIATVERSLAARVWATLAHRIVRPDGEVRWVHTSGAFVVGPRGDVIQLVGGTLDVTDEHLRDERRHQAQTLEAIGGLAAGVAHNFNNMLAVITSVLELVRPELSARSSALVGDAQDAARRAAEMVRQLLTYAGHGMPSARQPRAVAELVTRACALARQTFGTVGALEVELGPELGYVRATPGELEQVVVNLLLNARDAVRGRPSPTVRVVAARSQGADGDDVVELRVIDNGPGVSDEAQARLFEPFFTTKDVGVGTGLGLAFGYAVARDHGGALALTSTSAAGSTFTLTLPLTPDGPAVAAPLERPPARIRGRVVMLVDDEDPIRGVTRLVLEAHGARVYEARSAQEAHDRLAAGLRVDVVLLDRSMPDGPGERAVPRLRAAAPGAAVVLFTGQGVDGEVRAQVDGVVAKPFGSDELVAAIEAATRGGDQA